MTVEIWSDVVCPFCYIGKRNFENALSQFEHKDRIEVVWKSFQLVPDAKHIPGEDNYTSMAKHHGFPVQQARVMIGQVVQQAKSVGLNYDMDNAVWGNTFDAHRILHYAKSKGLGDKAKERLLHGHFEIAENLEDHETLIRIAAEIGLDKDEAREILTGNKYADEVRKDIAEAQQLGLRGVPSFVLDRKASFSGAVPPADILKVLKSTFAEWEKNNPLQANITGSVCTPDGKCD